MTFKEFMQENGYDLITTFWRDFSIADKYGIAGVKDTYKRAFNEWKDDYKFFTELTLVLNHKIWQHYESNRELAALYDRLWREADEYAMNNFKGEELDYYYRVTDQKVIMKNTIVTGSLIVFSDGFVWKRLSNEKAYKIWVSAENEDFELYKVRVDDESESLIESLEDLQDTFKQGHHVCIEVGKLPYSIGLNYLRNLQELSVEAVEYLTGPKGYSRGQAFNIIREWAKEFTEKYGNCDFDGSYYDEIDEFIDKKLGTI